MSAPADGLAALSAAFSGTILTAEDAGYDHARRVHNGLIDKHPSVIARCLNTADIVDAVNYGRDEGLEISVKGGGHNPAGSAVTDGGLMIDLSLMKGIHVDPSAKTARSGRDRWGRLQHRNRRAHPRRWAGMGDVELWHGG
jgi:FAD/FMN-containing dehydrogenase